MKDEDWDSVINTNLSGVFNVTKAFIKPIIKNKKGSILNISSVSGLMGNAGQVNYSASKAGLSGFTKSLAKEIGSRNITVNSIAPGFIETDMTDFLEGESKEDIINSIPLKRLGKANEVADLAFFLTTNEDLHIVLLFLYMFLLIEQTYKRYVWDIFYIFHLSLVHITFYF